MKRMPSPSFSLPTALCLLCVAGTALALLTTPAQAQVLRCTDDRTGAVSYTDGICTPGSEVQEVEPRRSGGDIERDRTQAAEALERKAQRLQTEAETARTEAGRNALRSRQQQQQPVTPADPARTPECARARRQLDAVAQSPGSGPTAPRLQSAQQQMELMCLGAERYAELERDRAARQPGVVYAPPVWSAPYLPLHPAYPVHPPHQRPPPPVPPPRFTHCNVFHCYDAQGRSYSRP